jgi:hypothetical protein
VIRSTRINPGGALLVLLALLTPALALAATHQDPKALAVVEALEKAIAPDGGWSKAGGLRFTFTVIGDGTAVTEVHHSWNVWSGQYRIDWKTTEGDQRMTLFNVGAKGKQGQAYIRLGQVNTGQAAQSAADGQKDPPNSQRTAIAEWTRTPPTLERQLLETGYGRFLNDTYWLLMPLKMRDPGVNLDYDGEKKIDGHIYDVVKLTFDHVGLTPGDTYWVYVNRETHLIDRWEYILEGGAERPDDRKSASTKAQERRLWIWKDWQSFGPVKLATTKTKADGSVSIVLKHIEVLPSMSENEFQPPKKPTPPHAQAPEPKKNG